MLPLTFFFAQNLDKLGIIYCKDTVMIIDPIEKKYGTASYHTLQRSHTDVKNEQ